MSYSRRDGSLLKKKQEEWAKQRAEKESEVWFPFGAPGCGSPLRKHEPISYENTPKQQSKPEKIEEENVASTSQKTENAKGEMPNEMNSSFHSQSSSSRENQQAMHDSRPNNSSFQHNVPSHIPAQPQFMQHYQYPPGQYQMPTYPYGYSILPPGTVPIPINMIAESVASKEGICPAEIFQHLVPTSNSNYVNYVPNTHYVYPIESSAFNSSRLSSEKVDYRLSMDSQRSVDHRESIDTSIDNRESIDKSIEDRRPSNVAVIAPMDKNDGNLEEVEKEEGNRSFRSSSFCENEWREGESGCSSSRYEQEILEQIELRKRKEAEAAELERQESLRIERERREREKREELERQREEEELEHHRKELERREQQLVEAIEKAKKEAEVRRKAKLFKHVLEGAERPDLEEKLLGVDSETGHRVLEQVCHLERQKKLDWEALNSSRDAKTKEQRSKSNPPKSRTMSMDSGCGSAVSIDKKSSVIRPHTDHRPIKPAKITEKVSPATPLSRVNFGRTSLRIPRKEGKENEIKRSGSQEKIPNRVGTPQKGRGRPEFRENTGKTGRKPEEVEKSPEGKMNHANSTHGNQSRIPVLRTRSRSFVREPRKMPSSERERNFAEALQLINDLPTHDFVPKLRPRTRNHIQAVEEAFNPLFSPINTRSRRMRPAVESPVNIQSIENGAGSLESTDAGSTSTESNQSPQTSPVPSINVELDYEEQTKFATPQKRPDELYNSRIRSRSALSSPAHYLNGNLSGRQSPLAASIYAKRIAEKGCKQHAEDLLSPDVRRRAEASLSRQSSMCSLKGSMSSLRTSMSNLSMNGGIENSPNLARYKSMSPAYRSFNMKKTSDKQKETLERLAALREQLRSKENFVTRPGLGGALSRQGSGHSMAKQ